MRALLAMTSRLILSASVWFLVLIACAIADDDLAARFHLEAPAAWSALCKLWDPAMITVDANCSGVDGAGTDWSSLDRFEMKLSGGKQLSLIAEIKASANQEVEGRTQVHCINDGRAFSLRRREPNPWYVVSLGSEDKAARDAVDADEACLLRSPLKLVDRPIDRMFEDGGFEVKRVEPSKSAGRDAVRVHFSYMPPAGVTSKVRHGWVDLLPELSWVVGGYQATTRSAFDPKDGPPSRVVEGVNRYEQGSASGAVRLASAEINFSSKDREGRPVRSTCKYEVVKFTVGPIPSSEFEPTAFGLNMPLSPPSESIWRRGLFWLTLAFFLAFLAAWLYQQSRTIRAARP